MAPLKIWQLLGLLVLVILAIMLLLRYSQSLQHQGASATMIARLPSWVQE